MTSREQEHDDSEDQNRWQARPVLAALLKLAVVSIPILCSLGAAWVASSLLPPSSGGTRWAYRAVVIAVALAAAMLAERGARRLLPMTTLLKLSLLFPDQAPSRFKVARKATSTQKLDQLAEKRDGTAVGAAANILSLLAALASHDKRTRGHAERVRVYADLLAQQMRLNREDQDRLRWASLLHDIGKLTVDPAILNKAGKPTDREWAILRAHPEEGARAAASLLGWLGEWGRAIAEHHERFDGTGYPGGLSGSEISRAGRMIAVVDAYEVMTAARSYKRPMSTLKAREELTRCANTHFDPVTVRAFLAISLPRLLWATGPLSFIVQLPFLGALRDAAQTIASAGGPAVAAAAGVVVVATGGPASAPATHATLSATKPKPIGAPAKPGPVVTPAASPQRVQAAPRPIAKAAVDTAVPPAPTSAPARWLPPPTPSPTATPTPTPTPTPTQTPAPPAAPDVQVRGGPGAMTSSTDATVPFTVSDPAATVTCSLDGGPAAPCSSPWSVTGLAPGAHLVWIDAAGAGGSGSDFYSWTVLPPAPVVTVTGGPGAMTSSTNATVPFTVSDLGATVTCSLDGGAATPCSSPWSASGLLPGPHFVVIDASNAGGSGSDFYNWTVLPAAPVVTVTGGPGATTAATSATVPFTVSDPTATVTCTLDGGAATPCSSPWSASGLAPGAHSVVIDAANAGGSGSDSYSWTVLPPAPVVTVTGGPGSSSSTNATVPFSVSDPTATVTCSLDGGAATPCSSPWSASGLLPGAHTVVIDASNAGGTGTDSHSWTVFPATPTVNVTSGPPSSGWVPDATVAFSVSDPAATVTCSLDGGPATPCSSPWSASGLAVGSHNLSISATNVSGTGSDSYSWSIQPPPVATITSGPADGSTVLIPVVTFTFVTDTPGSTFECSIDGAPFSACTNPATLVSLLSTDTFAVRAVIDGVAGPVDSRSFFAI